MSAKRIPVFAIALWVGFGLSASAHHSGAAYDSEHPKTMEGTVQQVNWTNPHVNYQVLMDPKDGKPGEVWSLESTSPGVLTRSGWTKKSLQPGDHATFQVAPTRTGAPSGYISKVTLSNGQVLTFSSNPADQ